MQTRPSITKPNREPDYIGISGAYFWFNELVYMSLSGSLAEMFLDESVSLLKICHPKDDPFHRSCGDCWRCLENKECERYFFAQPIQEAYKKWNIKVMETALGLTDA